MAGPTATRICASQAVVPLSTRLPRQPTLPRSSHAANRELTTRFTPTAIQGYNDGKSAMGTDGPDKSTGTPTLSGVGRPRSTGLRIGRHGAGRPLVGPSVRACFRGQTCVVKGDTL